MVSPKCYNYAITFTCLVGLGLSIYAYIVELAAEQNEKYEAMCDISENVSCTKAFRSKYGKGFGLVAKYLGENSILNAPNSLLGILYYSLLATLAQSNSLFITRVSLFVAILAGISSMYFAYILYFILYNLCVICVGTYAVNFINLLLIYYKVKCVRSAEVIEKSKKKE